MQTQNPTTMKNLFNPTDKAEVLQRINQLSPTTSHRWGKMTAAQMLAHCNVSYELVYEEGKHPKPNATTKLMLKWFVKETVVGQKPYERNSQTAPMFVMKDDKDFEVEKTRLINHINKTQELGEAYFDNKESHSFGALTKAEWNVMFYKHLDHHLKQFGV
jgi:hypothetical protein